MATDFQPGSLVKLRNRDWVVMPSDDEKLLLVKPLGGTDEETTGIFLPLAIEDEKPKPSQFPKPSLNDLGNYSTAKLLYNAARLSFRNVAGPFRSIGRYSFRPRSYQVVPLVMSLRQDVIRLLIADDVGVGKTIEALMVVREMLDRGEIKRFAVVCLPHLCDQWQQELRDKFSIDAVIVRSSTAAKLDRKIRGDQTIFKHYPYQVISIDFIKSDKKRSLFLLDCSELIIVDEAHTCTRPVGASPKQQQRYYLVQDIAKKKNQHLILMTATPHSGKQPEFQSLIGLLNPEYETLDIVQADYEKRKEIANHIVIRRRVDVQQWHETTYFPEREQGEIAYSLSPEYKSIFSDLLTFARSMDTSEIAQNARKKFKYFAILSLLRGVMSSPAAGIEMLTRKAQKLTDEEEQQEEIINPVADSDETDSDATPANLIEKIELKSNEAKLLGDISRRLENVKDNKAEETLKVVKEWIREGYNPIIFCRFIPTAKYLGEYYKDKLPKNTDLLVITGEMVDEERKARIDEFGESSNRKLLIATDCLSEGINLQKHFTAVLHYDLPWNPNRLEQREGRVDRFGQTAKKVKAFMLWGKDNPIDSAVLNVLLMKARQIRKQTGISVPFPEDSQSLMDSLLNAVILSPNAVKIDRQLELDLDFEEIQDKSVLVTKAYEKAAERDKLTHSVFAQHSIKVDEIEQDLKDTDEAIGDPETVKNFVLDSILLLKGQMKPYKEGYLLYTTNLPFVFKTIFNRKDEVRISFFSPTPEGYEYIGRNHPFVEQLSQFLLNNALLSNGQQKFLARTSVITTDKVQSKTAIYQLRVRNIISESAGSKQIVAEEMILWGYNGNVKDKAFLSQDEAKNLLEEAFPLKDLSIQRQTTLIESEINSLDSINELFKGVVRQRSEKLIEAHDRFRKLLGGRRYKVVEPVLPPDILGIYILLPTVK
jgi:superfamily II DNA or RNA helicase